MDRKDRREAWLKAFPGFRKFVNQCVVCQETGYDPEKLKAKRGFGFQKNAREFFKPLTVNEQGICTTCVGLGYPKAPGANR
jgi:DnaJ-class molecular chaperone